MASNQNQFIRHNTRKKTSKRNKFLLRSTLNHMSLTPDNGMSKIDAGNALVARLIGGHWACRVHVFTDIHRWELLFAVWKICVKIVTLIQVLKHPPFVIHCTLL
jgi:hypothetical protein